MESIIYSISCATNSVSCVFVHRLDEIKSAPHVFTNLIVPVKIKKRKGDTLEAEVTRKINVLSQL